MVVHGMPYKTSSWGASRHRRPRPANSHKCTMACLCVLQDSPVVSGPPIGSPADRVLFFSELIESKDFALDIALYVSNQTVAVTPHQVYLHYFTELPVPQRTIARKDLFIKTRNRVLRVDKTSGAVPMIQVVLRPLSLPILFTSHLRL